MIPIKNHQLQTKYQKMVLFKATVLQKQTKQMIILIKTIANFFTSLLLNNLKEKLDLPEKKSNQIRKQNIEYIRKETCVIS